MRRTVGIIVVTVLLGCGGGGGGGTTAPQTPAQVSTCTLPGGFTFSMEFGFSGRVPCGDANQKQQSYKLRNNSCDAITLQSLTGSEIATGNCNWIVTYSLPLAVTTVASGVEATLRLGGAPGSAKPACCARFPCSAGPCSISQTYTVQTSAGSRAITHDYTVDIAGGTACTLCYASAPGEWFAPGPVDSGNKHGDGAICRTTSYQ